MDVLDRIKKSREDIKLEYEMVAMNHIANAIIKSVVMVVDILIMMVLIWNVFAICVPSGSWFNIVDGTSMEPTMHTYQILYTDMATYGRGDIITAYMPPKAVEINPDCEGRVIVKRVIGVPGDTIDINEDGIFINGEYLEESYLTDAAKNCTYVVGGEYNSVNLNNNQYFIVGDNRGASFDSRYFGAVEIDDILYKQSLTPTNNFYLKLVFVVLVFAIDIYIYMLIERLLIDFAYKIMYKNKDKNKKSDDKKTSHTTSETIFLKTERRK